MLAAYSRALFAGGIGLAANVVLLSLADRLGIATAHGGFQRLLKLWTGPALHELGVDRAWVALHLPDQGSALFTNGFKIAVGLAMAVIYLWLEPHLPGQALVKGLTYALIVWLINAGIVLPALGQGFAGAATLGVAHTAFEEGEPGFHARPLAVELGVRVGRRRGASPRGGTHP